VKVAAIVLSVPLILEFVFAPVNLWTGRTIDNFVRFTGFDPRVARTWLAPLKLATAGLLTAGLAIRGLSLAGGGLALVIAVFYLVRLVAPGRRDPAGLLGFGLFGLLAAALLVIRIIQT
jgi:hypothetical protein